jgi:DMSO/TMAO reductase YedYZ molybdopterin-dependent catalytic subunit
MSDQETSLPPNQHLAAPGKWPVVGERAPRQSPEPWSVTVGGLVAAPRTWRLAEIAELPQVEQVVDIHCVTRWSKLGARFSGVPLSRLLDACRPLPEARFISFIARSVRRHSTSLPLADALRLGALVALRHEGEPLAEIHGGPARMIVPGRYFYKSVKWLERVELLAEDCLGYWEKDAGYHNDADPWLEQRYIAPDVDRRTIGHALATRDFSGKDFRSLDATGLDLAGLDARGALLRDANFQGVNLERACFDEANLSNAHFERAVLRHATFIKADVEGANFVGADLRGAYFTGASMLGATFRNESVTSTAAQIDGTTLMDETAIEMLAPAQQSFVRQSLS